MDKLERLRKVIENHRKENECSLYINDDCELCSTEYCDECDGYILGDALISLPYDEYSESEIFEVINDATDDDFVEKYDWLDLCTCERDDY